MEDTSIAFWQSGNVDAVALQTGGGQKLTAPGYASVTETGASAGYVKGLCCSCQIQMVQLQWLMMQYEKWRLKLLSAVVVAVATTDLRDHKSSSFVRARK